MQSAKVSSLRYNLRLSGKKKVKVENSYGTVTLYSNSNEFYPKIYKSILIGWKTWLGARTIIQIFKSFFG